MKISVLQRLPNGTLVPADALFPSLPCPEIKVTDFKIQNLRKDPNQEYGYICDVTAAGEVTSSLCDAIPTALGQIDSVRFYHNDSDKAAGTFAVAGCKLTGGSNERPFPFDGTFSLTLAALPVTDGNNTFRIAACDKVYGLDGFSLWAASFAFPYDSELDEEELEGVKEPTIVEGPQFVSGASGGELTLFCLALQEEITVPGLTCIAGEGQNATFEFKSLPQGNSQVAMWPGSTLPAFFSVRPTMLMASKMPSDTKMVSSLASSPSVASFSPRERFLYGFAQGLGFEGYDLVFDSDRILKGAARVSDDLAGMLIAVDLADANGRRNRGEATVGPPRNASQLSTISPYSTSGLLWHFSNLFRTSDPMASEVVVSLLLGDLSSLGLKGVSIADWREYFYMSISELLEELIKDTVSDSELAQGYYLGRGIADALRTTVDPTRSGRLDELGKADFLIRMRNMPFFNPKGRGGIALGQQASLIDRLKQFIEKYRE
ncbi:MAG: hypothetical protein IH623_02160 [Verrucomicrobia bacterium]|nr:hypothetical protein [Verrucomicrobiota bacterium]